MKRFFPTFLCITIVLLATASRCFAWAHQGHILMTRLAALRIIDDPTAPQGLRDFLSANMKHSMAECESLAVTEVVGAHLEQHPEYDEGLGKWATMPDQVRFLPEGQVKIQPYDAIEGQMHFLDLEAFGKEFVYKDDLSNKPNIADIPHDLKDPRWKRGGFVPLRVEEMYLKLVDAFGHEDQVNRPDDALRAAGYLAHYLQDSTQPHHSTCDFKSLSYLVGRLKELPATTQPATAVLTQIRAPKGVDPHGDIEFQLFENANEPRAGYRKEFWKELLADIDTLSAERAKNPMAATAYDPFRADLQTLSGSYDCLPFVGRAAQAAYESGTFDAKAFFAYEGEINGRKMNMVQLIALRNAIGVLDTEQAWRLAWSRAHGAQGHAG